jgi:hypothetical protein
MNWLALELSARWSLAERSISPAARHVPTYERRAAKINAHHTLVNKQKAPKEYAFLSPSRFFPLERQKNARAVREQPFFLHSPAL